MGYELHIVRQMDYGDDEETSNISLDEWLAYVATDPDLELTNGYQSKLPGFDISWNDKPGFCNWLGHPTNNTAAKPWFDYGFGSISAKYPDNDTIKKMIQVANALHAKVRGDDFEFYDDSYFINNRQSANDTATIADTNKPTVLKRKAWWKLWQWLRLTQ